ncbi:MAG: Trm112 family protein [Terracidiphilus sp.]|jgi:hypothetical protein
MPVNSSLPFAFDLSVVNQLACPACLGALRLEEVQLICVACGRVYPIVDGIPVLIAGREIPRG